MKLDILNSFSIDIFHSLWYPLTTIFPSSLSIFCLLETDRWLYFQSFIFGQITERVTKHARTIPWKHVVCSEGRHRLTRLAACHWPPDWTKKYLFLSQLFRSSVSARHPELRVFGKISKQSAQFFYVQRNLSKNQVNRKQSRLLIIKISPQ